MPMALDNIAPTARILDPVDGGVVTRGRDYLIRGHVWDNAAIARVEYRVDDKVQCSITDPVPVLSATSPFYYCWWPVPRRQRPYQLVIRVYDAAGNTASSDSVTVSAQ
jgi:hypothetical protein